MNLPKPPGSGLPKPPASTTPAASSVPSAPKPDPLPRAPVPTPPSAPASGQAAAAPSPSAPAFSLGRRGRYLLLGSGLLGAALLFVVSHLRDAGRVPPSADLLRELSARALRADSGQRIIAIDTTDLKTESDGQARFRIAARAEQTEPLYAEADAAAALLAAGLDARISDQISALLSRPDSAKIIALAGITDGGRSAARLPRLIRAVVPSGTTYLHHASALARPGSDGRARLIELNDIELQPSPAPGRLRSAFPGDSLDADAPETVEVLRKFATEAPALLARLQTAAQERDKQRENERAALVHMFAPGSVFFGQAKNERDGSVQALAFEIAKRDEAARRVDILLRNDGGWSLSRRFSGVYAIPADDAPASLTLATEIGQARADSGPFLSWREAWTVELQQSDQTWEAKAGDWRYTFKRGTDADREADIARWAATERKLAALFAQGSYLSLDVRLDAKTFSERLIWETTTLDRDGLPQEGMLSDESGNWKRPVRAQLITHAHANSGQPLRLVFFQKQRISQLSELSPLAWERGDHTVLWSFDGEKLLAHYGHHWNGAYNLTLEPIAKEEVLRLRDEAAARVAKITDLLKPGARFTGTALSETGDASSRIALSIQTVADRGKFKDVVAILSSVDTPALRRIARGGLDPHQALLNLKIQAEATALPDRAPGEPWFSNRGESTLSLEVDPAGKLHGKGSQNWTVELQLSEPAARSTENEGPAKPQSLSVHVVPGPLPPPETAKLPRWRGGYLLVAGEWKELKEFDLELKIFSSPVAPQSPGEPFHVGRFIFTPPPVVSMLMIDGKPVGEPARPLPVSAIQLRALLVRGSLVDLPATYRMPHRKLFLARVQDQSGSQWTMNLYMKAGDNVLIPGEQAVPCEITEPQANVHLLRIAGQLVPGTYVLGTTEKVYLLSVTP